jgi:putative oxidoreductase
MTSAMASHSRRPVVLWTLRVLMSALFIFAAITKLMSQSMIVDEFAKLPTGSWLRYFTGVIELLGGIALIIPWASAFGALLLLMVDLCAFIAQIVFIQRDWIHPIVVGVFLFWLVYLERDAILGWPMAIIGD